LTVFIITIAILILLIYLFRKPFRNLYKAMA
jgi:hypothetical protein